MNKLLKIDLIFSFFEAQRLESLLTCCGNIIFIKIFKKRSD